jgi:hypothetical protein
LEPHRVGEVVFEGGVDAVQLRQIPGVLRKLGQLFLRKQAQQLHRVVIGFVPERSIQPSKQLGRVVVPGPPQVARQLAKPLQFGRDVREHLERTQRGDNRCRHELTASIRVEHDESWFVLALYSSARIWPARS